MDEVLAQRVWVNWMMEDMEEGEDPLDLAGIGGDDNTDGDRDRRKKKEKKRSRSRSPRSGSPRKDRAIKEGKYGNDEKK